MMMDLEIKARSNFKGFVDFIEFKNADGEIENINWGSSCSAYYDSLRPELIYAPIQYCENLEFDNAFKALPEGGWQGILAITEFETIQVYVSDEDKSDDNKFVIDELTFFYEGFKRTMKSPKVKNIIYSN